jgi:hypothetical protein
MSDIRESKITNAPNLVQFSRVVRSVWYDKDIFSRFHYPDLYMSGLESSYLSETSINEKKLELGYLYLITRL